MKNQTLAITGMSCVMCSTAIEKDFNKLDGINDAPALAYANIGIALGSGTDVAIEAGDITSMNGNFNTLLTAVSLSRKTTLKIKQNLFWTIIYNTIGVPFSTFSLLSPIICGAAVAFSSVSAVTN